MHKKIILFGKDGQLGFALQRALSTLGTIYGFNLATCDLSRPDQIRSVIHEVKPDIIVNAAAYTAVDKAEEEKALAFAVNAEAPRLMAELAKTYDACFVHYSTDYVFDGTKSTPYVETDATNPLNQYGASKLAGEEAVTEAGGDHWILRTSWVCSHYGQNFLKTILRLAQSRLDLKVINDQFGVPTSADLLADVTAQMLRIRDITGKTHSGLYHLVPQGKTTWYDFAQFILTTAHTLGLQAQLQPENVRPIPATEYPLPAARPYNSCLDTTKIQETFDIVLPDWNAGVEHALIQLIS